MPRRQPIVRRWLTAASWPLGVALTSWDYMWRSTPMHRSEADVAAPAAGSPLLHLPDGVSDAEVLSEADGHGDGARVGVDIESCARSSGWFDDLLYHRLRMAKEIEAHMWISFLEGVVKLSGGHMTGGVTIETERIEDPDDEH